MPKTLQKTYQDHAIQFRDDGWFNATSAAAKYDKRPNDWLRLPDTTNYIAALERKYGKISYFKTTRGKHGGTWMHPKLGVPFARWLDLDFALWCDEQIEIIIHGTEDKATWQRQRHTASSSYKLMSEVLNDSRTLEGKETKSYHYINEAKMLNSLLTGNHAPLDRDALTIDQLDLLATLEIRNANMIARNIGYDIRKQILKQTAERALQNTKGEIIYLDEHRTPTKD